MFLRNHNFIGPFHFSKALVKWSMTGSKAAHSLDGAITASGSITSLRKVLQECSVEDNVCPPGDVDVFADNTQKICKTSKLGIKV